VRVKKEARDPPFSRNALGGGEGCYWEEKFRKGKLGKHPRNVGGSMGWGAQGSSFLKKGGMR